MSCTTFRMLSRGACAVHEIDDEHSRYPTKFFWIIYDLEIAVEVCTIDLCLLDPFTFWFVVTRRQRDPAKVGSKRSVVIVITITRHAKCETSAVEVRHAALRRWLYMRQVQCPTPSFEAAQAHFKSRQVVIREEEFNLINKPQPRNPAKPARPAQAPKPGPKLRAMC